MSNSIHQEVQFSAKRDRVYRALTDAAQFSALSGGARAEISQEAGGAFSCFGGMISGRQLELIPGQRIVQAWRAGNWDAGVYSIAKFELTDKGSGSLLTFDHTGFPVGQGEHLQAGWETNYWEPLKKYLA
jgi:activator of HSP90 ATPase